MNTSYKELKDKITLKRLIQFFFQGLIVLAPIAVTIWVVLGLFQWVDGFLPNLINTLFPSALDKNLDGSLRKIPGLGFVVVVVLVLFVGWLSSLFVVEKLVSVFDTVLEKTPGIKFIYFLEAFAGNKKKFDKPVLVNVDASGVWRIGFITQPSNTEFGLPEHVTVYVPHSYAISGITYIVPKTNIKILDNVSAVDAMKYTVSGGVTDVHDDSIIPDLNENETA